MHFYSRNSTDQCMPPERVGEGAELIDEIENACGYMESKGHFPIMPEDVTLNLIHSYRTSSVINKKGSLPRTIIRAPNYDGEETPIESILEQQVALGSYRRMVVKAESRSTSNFPDCWRLPELIWTRD